MVTENRLRLADVFVSITDPRQSSKVEHDLVELLVIAVNAVLVGADTFVEIELWARERIDWLRRHLRLENGIPSHDTFGRLFGVIDPDEFEAAFRRWASAVIPRLGPEAVVAIDGKTSRRSGGVGATPLHLVSAFAAGAGLVLGQRATAKKSNEKSAIPELLSTLALEGCIVTIDAMGTQANIAQAIRDRGADYVLAVKDNQPLLADSIWDFFTQFQAVPECTPHSVAETVEKDHGRIEVRRCWAFDQTDCLARPEQWDDLQSFAVIESERCIQGKTSVARRFYLSSLRPMRPGCSRLFGPIGRSRIACIGAWTSPSPMIRCAPVPSMPHITSPSSSTSPLTSSASIPLSARAASRPVVSSPQPPILIANTSSDLFDVHAIALVFL